MKPIPTTYNSITFRSRTEARFAEFLDHHNQRWVYEPEAFGDGKFGYLPDFWLPKSRMIVEIKPAMFLWEQSKIERLLADQEFHNIEFLVATMEPNLKVLRFAESGKDIDYDPRKWSFEANLRADPADPDDDYGALRGGFCLHCHAVVFDGDGVWGCDGCGKSGGEDTHGYELCCGADGDILPSKLKAMAK